MNITTNAQGKERKNLVRAIYVRLYDGLALSLPFSWFLLVFIQRDKHERWRKSYHLIIVPIAILTFHVVKWIRWSLRISMIYLGKYLHRGICLPLFKSWNQYMPHLTWTSPTTPANDIAWNLSLAYIKDNQIDKALVILDKLKNDNPDTPISAKAGELMKRLKER